MAGCPVNLSQVSGHVHYFSQKCYSLRYWKPLIFFLLFYNYIVKMLQINNQNYTLKFTRAKDYITQCTFMQLKQSLGSEVLEPRILFYSFNIQYILIYLSTIKKSIKQKTGDRIRGRKAISFISFFITGVHFLHLVPPHPLIFNVSCSFLSMFYCTHIMLFP